MGVALWEGNKAQSLLDLLEAQNHLISHQNAAIDLLASDKRAELTSDIEAFAELVKSGEILEVMDFGDQINIPWKERTTEYVPPMNLCHVEEAELEDGEKITVADLEWHYTIPFGMPFDAAEAVFESESDLEAGAHYFTVANDSWGGNNGKSFTFTTPEDLPAGGQLRKTWAYNAACSTGKLQAFASADSRTVLWECTVSEGTDGTFLGTTDGSGDVNHYHRLNLGYNRWSTSNMRQFLNATLPAGQWWTKQNKWDVKPAEADTYDGFLYGYGEEILQHIQATKIQTACNTVTDGGVIDTTYDRVFLSSLEQMYAVPQVAGVEGEYWEYYKRLLGRTTPAPTSQTYTRLIKYVLNVRTSAQYCFRRSANRGVANGVWSVTASGYLHAYYAYYGFGCAPCLRIG